MLEKYLFIFVILNSFVFIIDITILKVLKKDQYGLVLY